MADDKKRSSVPRLLLVLLPLLCRAAPAPADWVPVRWPWSDAASLELIAGGPVNCLLLRTYSDELTAAAARDGVVMLAVVAPGDDVAARTRAALDHKLTGVVLEGEFPDSDVAKVREIAGSAPVAELTSRRRLRLGSGAPILGTYQGVWPGVSALEQGGAKHSGPTASVWIDTNTGFIRAARAWGDTPLWIANQPPAGVVVTGSRYLQVISDAAISGARWVVAFDSDFARRLHMREADAMSDWRRMSNLLAHFDRHPEWRRMQEYAKLAVVQDPGASALLSGGVLDMIAVKHTPVRPVPRERLSSQALDGALTTLNVDPSGMTTEQREILRAFARSGGTLLTGPPGWRDQAPKGASITLDKAELERLNDIWRDINGVIGRRNFGVRLFNVATMLSNLLISPDGKTALLHLVNYSDYPVENVTAHFLGKWSRATLIAPDREEARVEVYSTEEGSGVDLAKVTVCATVKLEQ